MLIMIASCVFGIAAVAFHDVLPLQWEKVYIFATFILFGIWFFVEKKRCFARIGDSNQKLHSILTSIRDCIFILEDDGRISYANPAAYELVGATTKGQQESLHLSQIMNEQEIEIAYNRIRELFVTRKKTMGRVYHLHRIDSLHEMIPVEIYTTIFSDAGKEKILGVARPIKERLLLQEEQSRADRMNSISTLAGGIAHDFNNLLASISGYASMLLYREQSSPRQYLSNILLAVDRATGLTQQLLTFAKGGASVKKHVSIAEIIKKTTLIAVGANSQVRCELLFDDDLKMSFVDPKQIGQVFQNLMINASHAMPDGGIIHITGKNIEIGENNDLLLDPGSYVHFAVRDSGIGIPDKYLSRIFEPYFTTKSATEGTGLGLSVAYSIIAKHDGHIGVRSEVGKGTTFHVYIPAVDHVSAEKTDRDTVVVKRGYRILLADDIEMNRKMYGEILRNIGHTCNVVADGAEALQLYIDRMNTGDKFDLVITDLAMPTGMGGVELIEKLRQIDSHVVIICMSGRPEQMPETNGFLQKPFNILQLQELIDKIMT